MRHLFALSTSVVLAIALLGCVKKEHEAQTPTVPETINLKPIDQQPLRTQEVQTNPSYEVSAPPDQMMNTANPNQSIYSDESTMQSDEPRPVVKHPQSHARTTSERTHHQATPKAKPTTSQTSEKTSVQSKTQPVEDSPTMREEPSMEQPASTTTNQASEDAAVAAAMKAAQPAL